MKVPRPYGALFQVAWITLIFYVVQRWVMAWTPRTSLGTDLSTLLWSLPSFLAGLGAVLLTKRGRSLGWRETFDYLGFKKITIQRWGLGLVLATPILVGYGEGYYAYTHKGFSVALVPEWPFLLVWFFMGSIFFEELVFRGFLFQSLRERWAFWPSALLSSFAWALAHFGNAFLGSRVRFLFPDILIFFLGLAGAYVFERTGNSLWSWSIVHMAINLVGMVDIGGAGLFLTPLGAPIGYLFGGEIFCLILTGPIVAQLIPRKTVKK